MRLQGLLIGVGCAACRVARVSSLSLWWPPTYLTPDPSSPTPHFYLTPSPQSMTLTQLHVCAMREVRLEKELFGEGAFAIQQQSWGEAREVETCLWRKTLTKRKARLEKELIYETALRRGWHYDLDVNLDDDPWVSERLQGHLLPLYLSFSPGENTNTNNISKNTNTKKSIKMHLQNSIMKVSGKVQYVSICPLHLQTLAFLLLHFHCW